MGSESERTSPLLLDFDARLGLEMQLQHTTTVYSCDGISNHCEGSVTMSSHSSDAFNTASQRRDCERQKKVTHKYSVPFPPELPFLSSNRPPPLVHNSSQPNWSGWDLSFSSSSSSPGVTDPEPWRCKRTDGKKWRCSRDVAPDHKYCERHAHKSRTRSRKHVELPAGSCNNNATVAQQRSTFSQYPTTMAASSADQTRCLQWKQPTHASSSPSPSFRLYTDSISTNSSSVYLPPYNEDKQDLLMSLNSYIPYMDNHFQTDNGYQSCDSIQGAKTSSLLSLCPNYTTQTFIDAWENEGKKFEQPSSTLSQSVSGGIKIIDEDQNGDMNSGNLWMNVGGPLGEALCLGNANTTRVCSYLASPQGYSNSSNTDTTNSSKSNCDEDGRSHGL